MRPRLNLATVIFTIAVVVATALVTIILRNPATHSNLESPEFYERTELAYLGQNYLYTGYGTAEDLIRAGIDPHVVGRALYVRAGCIGCHGVYGQGGVVGSSLWDLGDQEPSDLIRYIRYGPAGMPAYPEAVLTDQDIELVLAFLESAPGDAVAAGVTTTTTPPPVVTTTVTTTTAPDGATATTAGPMDRTLGAPRIDPGDIVVDGDPSDWAVIDGLQLTLEAVVGGGAPSHPASVKIAHDGTNLYVLFTVDDDFEWSDIDPHLSGAPAILWAIESGAGPHMGGEAETGFPGLGLVDIWYWRLECPIGIESGGAVGGPGTGDPGNDDACGLDDEWASDPSVVEDDAGTGAENSILGVFGHSNPVNDTPGTWFFEFSRPLQTGDPLDAQFAAGETARLALAYWDPDAGENGWGRRDHVQSSSQGWIDVEFAD